MRQARDPHLGQYGVKVVDRRLRQFRNQDRRVGGASQLLDGAGTGLHIAVGGFGNPTNPSSRYAETGTGFLLTLAQRLPFAALPAGPHNQRLFLVRKSVLYHERILRIRWAESACFTTAHARESDRTARRGERPYDGIQKL